MDFNNINDIIGTDDQGIDPIVYLASQFCLPYDVFEDIPAGIRYSIAFEEEIQVLKKLVGTTQLGRY